MLTKSGGLADTPYVAEWQQDYPWLQLAFRQFGAGGKAASEEWQWRIEEDLGAPLDYQVRPDGTAAVWCGLTQYDFEHEPTPKGLLQGLNAAYRRELHRRGWLYPNLKTPATKSASGPVTVTTRYGPIEISWADRNAVVEEIRSRHGSDDLVVRIFEAIALSRPVNLDRKGRIVVLDALWAIADRDEGRLAPQLQELRDRLTDEIAAAARA